MSLRKLALVIAGTMVLAACTPTTEPEAPGDGREAVGGQDGGLVTQPLPDDGTYVDGQPVGGGVGAGAGDASLVGHTIIYFDFDSAAIRAEYAESIAAHAASLVDNPNLVIRLEGHTDERGSREYNIGLGERRAQAVRQALLLQGAGAAQISTVSYGEERPAVTGEDDEAWAMNRRVEIVYLR